MLSRVESSNKGLILEIYAKRYSYLFIENFLNVYGGSLDKNEWLWNFKFISAGSDKAIDFNGNFKEKFICFFS